MVRNTKKYKIWFKQLKKKMIVVMSAVVLDKNKNVNSIVKIIYFKKREIDVFLLLKF